MRLIGRLLVVCSLLLLPAISAFAQSTPDASNGVLTPFGNGIGSEAAHMDQRGESVVSLTVIGVERDWQGYDEYSTPQDGKDYVFVSLELTNYMDRVYIVDPYDFALVDSLGMETDRKSISRDNRVMSEKTTINGGDTIEVGIVFEIFSDLDPLLLMYEPENYEYVFIYLGE